MDMYVLHMESLTRSVAQVVADAIEAHGQTQLGISEATGIPRTTLLRRLSGVTSFTVAELAAIADVLEVDLKELLERAGTAQVAS